MLAQVVYVLLASWCMSVSATRSLEEVGELFESYIEEFAKEYPNEHVKQAKFRIFVQNLEKIDHMNQIQKQVTYGINQFTDLTLEEFINTHTGFKPSNETKSSEACKTLRDQDIYDMEVGDSFDWRELNVVTNVKDQMYCGSCYAFSSTGNIEGQYAIKYGNLVSLSEQQIVDCDQLNTGCGGGFMEIAFRTIINMGGIESETAYPYDGYDETCKYNEDEVVVELADCNTYDLNSQEKLKQLLVQQGPISIVLDATQFHNYQSGVLGSDCFTGNLDHAVLIVGFGTDDSGTDYWLIKNSWGEGWGEQGYFRVERGEGKTSCGLMNEYMASSIVA